MEKKLHIYIDFSDINFIKRKISEYLPWNLSVSCKELEASIKVFQELMIQELTPYVQEIFLDGPISIKNESQEINHSFSIIAPYYDNPILSLILFKDLKNLGTKSIKLIVYYDINVCMENQKKREKFILNMGNRCKQEGINLFLELRQSYDYMKINNYIVSPTRILHILIDNIKKFSRPIYHITELIVDFPNDFNIIFKKPNNTAYKQVMKYLKEQSNSTSLPYLFHFENTSQVEIEMALLCALRSGANLSGISIGSNFWLEPLEIFVKSGKHEARIWLRTTGRNRIKLFQNISLEK